MSEFSQKIGVVRETILYPVVGMPGVTQPEGIHARKHSLVKDRSVLYTKDVLNKEGDVVPVGIHTFDEPKLLLYQPRLETPGDIKNSRIIVLTPDGREYFATEKALLDDMSNRFEHQVDLAPQNGKNYGYSASASMMSTQTLEALSNQLMGYAVDQARFRMNVLYDLDTDPLPEEVNKEQSLVGKQIKIGNDGVILYGWEGATRCRTVNSLVQDGELTYNPAVFVSVPLSHGAPRLGLYAGINDGGLIRPGDNIYLNQYPPATEYN